MIEVYVNRNRKPIKKINCTVISSEPAFVPIVKIKNFAAQNKQPHYMCLVYQPEIHAKYNDEWPIGEVWLNLTKADNTQHKLPVLKPGEYADV